MNYKRFVYNIKQKYLQQDNLILAIAVFLAFLFVAGTVSAVQKNYNLQEQLIQKQKQEKYHQLEVYNLEFQNKYLTSEEYQEIAVREQLSLAAKGEKVLIVDEPEVGYGNYDVKNTTTFELQQQVKPSNFKQWYDFLSGKNIKSLENSQ